jgi:hypothetical protein
MGAHDPDHILDLERAGEKPMAHVAAGRVVQFDLLQMETRVGKSVEIADMVVVHVRQYNIFDGIAVDASGAMSGLRKQGGGASLL